MTLPVDFLAELKKRFTGDLRLDLASKVLYSTDASIYQIEPLGVAVPKTQEDLHAAVELAAKYRLPILPRGSGTSLAGQAVGEALILDCSRHLDSIIEINPEEHSATIEPGVILSNLNRAATKHGLMFGPDPASAERATMGGVIGNNATGAHSILYGMSADHLLEAEVILGDGSLQHWGELNLTEDNGQRSAVVNAVIEIRKKYSDLIKKNYPKSWRNSAGYRLNYLLPWSPSKPPQWNEDYPNSKLNLAPLLAGSEGTLAVIRRMKVNLVKKPKHTLLGVLQYQSIESACDDVPRLLEFNPSAVELIPQMILQLARIVSAAANQMSWIAGNPEAILVVEFSGGQMSALREAARNIGDVITIAESLEEQNQIWNIRKSGLGILDSRPQSARPIAFIEDCAIPVERLGAFVREVETILQAHRTYAGIYAHASGGCLHIRPVLDLTRGEGVRAMRSISEQVFALTMRLGGSMSSEHGDGVARGEYIERTYGKEVAGAMRLLKRAADPNNILNPKKLFDAPPMDTNLRYGENYQANVWDSALHFEHEHGLAGAIEMCNGQGVCRKSNGLMCPSFQASGEEGLSTRGRANLLRAVIGNQRSAVSGQRSELEEAAFKTLDLCLACKGCTSECPSGVDMPRLKYEFMNQYYKSHRRPLRDYLFAYFDVIAKRLSLIAPAVNVLGKLDWSKKIATQILGLTDKRPLPLFAERKINRANQTCKTYTTIETVLFLSDVFSEYLEPEVTEAAIDLLNYFGYEVKALPTIGAGAAFLSKGLIKQAKRHAEKVLGEIKRLDAESKIPVVGCEPPEVYCLKHEYSALLPHRKTEIESISKRVFLVEEFLLRVVKLEKSPNILGKLPNSFGVTNDRGFGAPHGPRARLLNRQVFFHPHCHQRAEGELATVELLKLFGFDVQVSDAGCCGMAGTFGFDKEHYELSMRISELKLLPKIREAIFDIRPSETSTSNIEYQKPMIASSGSACRMQIRHGTGVAAKHPLIMIRDAILKNLHV